MIFRFRQWCQRQADIYMPLVDRFKLGRSSGLETGWGFDGRSLDDMAKSRKVFQPSADQELAFSRTIRTMEPGKRSKLIVDELPYSWYPSVAGGDSTRIMHPGVLGRRLFELAKNEQQAKNYLQMAKSVSVTLPNGGVAYYYPRQIKITRLLGPDLAYSGMTASDVLAGYVSVLLNTPKARSWCNPKEAFLAMTFPWEEGGVNLENRAILELPLFRSAPEVVLNGWLHALLFLSDYVKMSSDLSAAEFLRQNLLFLSQTLNEYDDEYFGLSRYSDSSPYRISLNWHYKGLPDFYVYYRAKHEGFKDIVVKLDYLDNKSNQASAYDNQLLAIARFMNHASATISVSSKYDTIIVSPSGRFSLTLDPGRHEWMATTPRSSGKRIKLNSVQTGAASSHLISISGANLGLMTGSPTSFSKRGNQNYYHMQHVVALLYLAKSCRCDVATRDVLIHYSDKWHNYARHAHLPEGLSFADPDDVLAAIHRGKPFKNFKSFHDLQSYSPKD